MSGAPTGTSQVARERPASGKPFTRSLDDDVQFVKGVGPEVAKTLAKLDIRTVGDVLRHVPRRYEDRRAFLHIGSLMPGAVATIRGRVVGAESSSTSRRNLSITRVLIDDGTGVAQLTFFQQPYLQRRFEAMARAGASIVVYGQAKRAGYGPVEIEHPEWEEVDADAEGLSTNRIVPVYPATEGITQKRLRRIADAVLRSHLQIVADPLPDHVREARSLPDAHYAYREIHYPSDWDALRSARYRLVFEQFFELQVGLARRRASVHETEGIRFDVPVERITERLHAALPFELTAAQKRAVAEIARDVGSGHTMNRLIQGDVGCGKTLVAVAAMLMADQSGYQSAMMAPTEILAQQHAIVLRRLLEPLGIAVELATGSARAKEKAAVRERLASGESRVAVGTHALIQEGVEFARLGLVVIDEQHRFGVLQRQALHRKGERPHVLVMTATPIPRTLTLTVYGDLDTTIIDELPPGRKPIKTHWKRQSDEAAVYGAMRSLLDQGRQAYVVCPLVEESEKLQARAATQLAEHIQRDQLPDYRIGLLHGQMRPPEKEEAMRRFKAHELDVLVATPVIEVGVDVPNACVMVVADADRFGLAQLHQLRGRVGRGEHPSFCVLLADPKTDEGRDRLRVMVETQDGFRIAEEDLRLRGPGEVFGTRQSGLPEFFIGDIVTDREVMEAARADAFALVASDPNLVDPAHAALKDLLARSRMGYELIHIS